MDKPGATEKGEDKEDDRKLFSTHGKTLVRSSQRRKQANRALSKNKHGYSTFRPMLCEWLLNSGAYMHCTLVMPV